MENTRYSCDLCKKVFNQKIDYTRHKQNKKPCITLDEIQKINQSKEEHKDKKVKLTSTFKSCLNILRGNGEGLTGEKALRNLSYLLILKLIEPHFGNEIDIDNCKYYDFSHIENIDSHKNKLLEIVRFSNLCKENEDNIPIIMKYLWDDILSKHPSTKNIYLEGKGFDIQHKKTFKKLIDTLSSIDLTTCEDDILGESYEEVIQDMMTGKILGQFFTPNLIKKMMIELINPQIHPDGKIDTCADPTMGTGGFLISYMRYILKQAKTKNIIPNWDFIKSDGIYGKELEPDTYQLGVSNMLISSGHMFNNLEKGDSIRVPIERKFDNVLANPPFGIKGFNYDDFHHPLKSDYLPIKTDNAVSLFIQAIIYMLKINGKCAIVLPDGQDLFSTNSTLVAIREYLMKTCDLKEIIYLPSGIFSYTTIKTCVFYFVKKREGNDVLETNIKLSKTHKESSRDYKFSKTHQTTKVKFYDYNPYENIKNLLIEVLIDKIVSNSYSLNYAEYMKDETEEEQYEEGIIVKTLGEVCSIIKGEKKRSKDGKENGLYPLYYCSILGNLYLDTFDYTGEGIIINKTNGLGKAMVYYGCNKYNVGETTLHFKSSNENELKTKYIYYYLLNNIDTLQKYYKGANQKSIVEDDLFKIKFPIPSLERQEEIVKYLDFIYEKSIKTSNEKIAELKQLNEFCLNNQKMFGDNVIKKLGEICEFKNGKAIKKDILIEGEYPVIGGGQKPMGLHNKFNTNENSILCSSSGAYAGFISKYYKKVWASDCFSIIPKDNLIDNNYLYYLLKATQDKLYKSQTGIAQPHVYSKDLQDLKIPIPSLERQQEIVEYCEYNDMLIKQLEKEIEKNKKEAQQFIKDLIKTKPKRILTKNNLN
jgi:type I restriction enzyme S subunit